MKILMITENLMKGGKERRLLELLRFLDNQMPSYTVELVLLRNQVDYSDVYNLKNTRVTILKRFIKKDPTIYFKIWNIYRKLKPDLIHSWGSMPSVYVFPISFIYGIPLINAMIANSKCERFSSEWFRFKLTYPFSKVILANSNAGLKAFNVGKKGMVIYNGFNFDRLNNVPTEKNDILLKYHIETKFVVGMVAAFHPRKDYMTFLEGAKELCEIRNDITFIAIGKGSMLNSYIEKYRGITNIIFTGEVHEVEKLMSCFDIGVLLTNNNNHLEGISNSILEMMAIGKPVIASKGGGTDEIVINQKTGILVDPFSKEQFKESVLFLLNNIHLREEYGSNAQQIIRSKFSIQSMCTQTIDIYNKLTQKAL